MKTLSLACCLGTLLISGCSNNLYYNKNYLKDGKVGGYADDLFECEKKANRLDTNAQWVVDQCMKEKGWLPTNQVEF